MITRRRDTLSRLAQWSLVIAVSGAIYLIVAWRVEAVKLQYDDRMSERKHAVSHLYRRELHNELRVRSGRKLHLRHLV